MLFEILMDWLYPGKCAFCHKITENGILICGQCIDELPYTGELACKQEFTNMDACYSPLYYEKNVRESILRYKFSNASLYCKVYAYLLGKCIDENKIFCDIITWVPLSKRRLRGRGYDQAELIAAELSKMTDRPCKATLRKIRHTKAQSVTGNTEKRKVNIAGAYASIDAIDLKGKTVLIIDDVVTTGATLSECAGILKRAGASEVYAMTVARKRN